MNSDNFLEELFKPSNLLVGFIGLTVLAIWGEYTFTVLAQPNELDLSAHITLILSILAGLLGIYVVRQRRRKSIYRWREGEPLPPHKGLVVVLSTPGIVETLLEHHGSNLQHLWIITNYKHEAFSHFFSTQLKEYRDQLQLSFQHHPIHIEDDIQSNAQIAYEATKKALEDAVANRGLAPQEIVVDITGGTKEMTAGVVLACSRYSWKMSYVRSEYAWDSDQKRNIRVPNSEKVLKFDIAFTE